MASSRARARATATRSAYASDSFCRFADGVVTYDENPSHRRAKLVRLTPTGRAALRGIERAQRAWADDVGSRIGAGDLERGTAVLGRVIDALGERRPPA